MGANLLMGKKKKKKKKDDYLRGVRRVGAKSLLASGMTSIGYPGPLAAIGAHVIVDDVMDNKEPDQRDSLQRAYESAFIASR